MIHLSNLIFLYQFAFESIAYHCVILMSRLILSLFQREPCNELGGGGGNRGTSLLYSQMLIEHSELCLAASWFKSAFNNENTEDLRPQNQEQNLFQWISQK